MFYRQRSVNSIQDLIHAIKTQQSTRLSYYTSLSNGLILSVTVVPFSDGTCLIRINPVINNLMNRNGVVTMLPNEYLTCMHYTEELLECFCQIYQNKDVYMEYWNDKYISDFVAQAILKYCNVARCEIYPTQVQNVSLIRCYSQSGAYLQFTYYEDTMVINDGAYGVTERGLNYGETMVFLFTTELN